MPRQSGKQRKREPDSGSEQQPRQSSGSAKEQAPSVKSLAALTGKIDDLERSEEARTQRAIMLEEDALCRKMAIDAVAATRADFQVQARRAEKAAKFLDVMQENSATAEELKERIAEEAAVAAATAAGEAARSSNETAHQERTATRTRRRRSGGPKERSRSQKR